MKSRLTSKVLVPVPYVLFMLTVTVLPFSAFVTVVAVPLPVVLSLGRFMPSQLLFLVPSLSVGRRKALSCSALLIICTPSSV